MFHTLLEMASEDKRIALTVSLLPRAREVIDGIREDTGIAQTEAMVRLLEFFASLDRKLRLAILNRDQETKDELVRLVMIQLVGREAMEKFIESIGHESMTELFRLIAAKYGKLAERPTKADLPTPHTAGEIRQRHGAPDPAARPQRRTR